jgi:hypothetical protein
MEYAEFVFVPWHYVVKLPALPSQAGKHHPSWFSVLGLDW